MNVDTLARMDNFLGPVSSEALRRVQDVDLEGMSQRLDELHLGPDVIEELMSFWEETRQSPRWSSLLGALVSSVQRDRGNIDAPIPIWGDLDDYGPCGRLLYYYLFALQVRELRAWYEFVQVPDDVSTSTIGALTRHGETHRLQHGTVGVDAGWWMLPILRGELLQIRSLKFHRVHLDVGTLAPRPWLEEKESQRRGEGFRPGDQSLGVHIPARTDLSSAELSATFARAREVLAKVWPCRNRRIVTCQSWMMDERLIEVLGEESRIVGFQRRFELIAPYADDVETVVYFVFGGAAANVATLKATSRLQRAVQDVLTSGGSWHSRTGWLDLDQAGVQGDNINVE